MVAAIGVGVVPSSVGASHSWGGYHWARTQNPFTLRVGDNVGTAWDSYLATTSSDWSISTMLDTTIVPGASNVRRCNPTSGRVEVCNARYGSNGWLGVAQIWANGSHITQGTVKVNDTYFSTAAYNTPAWRNLVMCQEVGHALGLDHQDEAFDNPNLGTCMDYTQDPTSNQHPNQHNYDELESIYSHLDSSSTLTATTSSSARGGSATDSEWGRLVAGSAAAHSVAVYVRDLGAGQQVVTFVVWAA